MRIAINALSVGPEMTGIGRYASDLVRAAEMASTDITVIGDPGVAGQLPCWRPDVVSQLWEQLELPDRLCENGVDVYHCPLFTCPVIANTPAVVTVHDAIPWMRPDLCSPSFLHFFEQRIGPSLRAARWIVTTSEHARGEICQVTGLRPDQVTVLYQSVDAAFFEDRPSQPPSGFPTKYILYTGMLEERKNLRRLVQAFGKIAADVPHDLVLAGRTDSPSFSLESTIRDAGVQGRVHLPGYLSQADLVQAYNCADLFVFPSLYEGFGRPVVEAMASGTPVVTSRSTSLPEVAGGAAALVDPMDADDIAHSMRAILHDEDRRVAMATAGRRRALTFSPAAFAERLRAFYARIEGERCA